MLKRHPTSTESRDWKTIDFGPCPYCKAWQLRDHRRRHNLKCRGSCDTSSSGRSVWYSSSNPASFNLSCCAWDALSLALMSASPPPSELGSPCSVAYVERVASPPPAPVSSAGTPVGGSTSMGSTVLSRTFGQILCISDLAIYIHQTDHFRYYVRNSLHWLVTAVIHVSIQGYRSRTL